MNLQPAASDTASQAVPDTWASADDSQYRVASDVEVAYILRGLLKAAAPITASFNSGREFVVTAVLNVSAEQRKVVLDVGASQEANERLLKHPPVRFVSNQDGVRVQFEARQVDSVIFEGKPAFRIALPSNLTKYQRREYYRLPTPVVNPIRCEIPLNDSEPLRLVVSDISLGGLCLVGELAHTPPPIGTMLKGCRVPLPDIGTLRVDLTVRNTYLITLKNGASSRRTGCQFANLGASQEAMVQRYIIRQERERRAKSG
ncbi:MAG TPA: flagellar brake protein [Burkholderiales bacterium]|nr:flagellar brake protein [Burkholderiales bacterium]